MIMKKIIYFSLSVIILFTSCFGKNGQFFKDVLDVFHEKKIKTDALEQNIKLQKVMEEMNAT